MSQVSDYNIANASGASVRSDLNAVFDAIKTLNSGGSDPSNTAAFMPYVDTADSNNLKIRNAANNGFTTVGSVDSANLGLLPRAGGTMTGQLLADDSAGAGAPAIAFDGDPDTGIFRSGSGLVSIAANGVKVATFPTSAGSSGQVLSTNGSGVLSFVDQSGGGAVGGGSDKLFMENGTTMTTNYTIGTEFGATANALSAGPITINAGVTLTIPSGSVYTVV